MHTNEKTRRGLFAENAKFSIRVGTADPRIIIKELQREIHSVAGKIIEAWNKYLKVISEKPHIIIKALEKEYNKALKRVFEHFVLRKTMGVVSDEQVKKIRNERISKFLVKLPVISSFDCSRYRIRFFISLKIKYHLYLKMPLMPNLREFRRWEEDICLSLCMGFKDVLQIWSSLRLTFYFTILQHIFFVLRRIRRTLMEI
jgi:hypothetical protein